MPTCKKCKLDRPEGHFTSTGSRCKQCSLDYRNTPEGKAAYNKYQREYQREYQRKHPRARRGLSQEALAKMIVAQGNVCALCRKPFEAGIYRGPAVDHDHATGKVRGILHNSCNIGLGHFADDPALLEAAKFYLKWFGDKR